MIQNSTVCVDSPCIEKSNFKTRFQWFDAFDQINTIEYRGMNVTKRSILENMINSSWLEMTHQELSQSRNDLKSIFYKKGAKNHGCMKFAEICIYISWDKFRATMFFSFFFYKNGLKLPVNVFNIFSKYQVLRYLLLC